MEPKLLSQLASFGVARSAWSCYIQNNSSKICAELFRDFPSYDWKDVDKVETFFLKLCDHVPKLMLKDIRHSLIVIGKELSRWRSHLPEVIHNFDAISWTPFLTIDRVRTRCVSKKFDINSPLLCECCQTKYVDEYLSNFSPHEIRKLQFIFGEYLGHATLYWYWYGRYNRSFLSHVWKYYRSYQKGKPIENIFKLTIFCEYDAGVIHYWSRMTKQQQLSYHNLVIPLMLLESDNLPFIQINELLPSHTFYFFWHRLNNDERWDIIQSYFLDFFRYMLYHVDGLELVNVYLEGWNPFLAPMEYYQVLRLSIDTNNLDLYKLLWKRKLTGLPFESIGHLMCTLLSEKDEDFELCIMMINDYDGQETKIEILNELDKRIECIRLNPNVIDEFLDSAELDHLRSSGFPRNPLSRTTRPWPAKRFLQC